MITFFASVFTALAHLLLSWSLEQAMITTEKKNVQEKKKTNGILLQVTIL